MQQSKQPKLLLGVSSCLLGQKVRFDAGHKQDSFLIDTLARYAEFVPICPEVDIGLGIPRESIRLEGDPRNPRLVAPKSGRDLTERMQEYSERRVEELAPLNLHGYVLKSKSPSCGMVHVRLYQVQGGGVSKNGVGIYAAALLRRFPTLPVEEEGRLHDPALRENFVERLFARRRWLDFLAAKPTAADLVRFHTRHKLALLAHSTERYRELGRLTANAGVTEFAQLLQKYELKLMETLKQKATPRKHANVLYHLAGYLKTQLDSGDKQELTSVIEDYRNELVPLVVPITLLKHHFRRYPVAWVAEQTYLDPYPAELMLRNHV